MHKFKGANGTPFYVDPQAIAMVRLGERGDVTWLTLRGTNDEWGVRESPEEVVALIESAARPAADADYAPLVDAARRLVEFLRDSDSVVTGYAPVAHALAVALAALPAREPRDGNVEVPRG
jgi:leucyl aminopeptidase (aminopeptidase T)